MPSVKATKGVPSSRRDGIVVSVQQSRFHADAVDAPESKEIDIKDLTLSIGSMEILEHANLRLQEGVHYVFHGRNGTGKSTILKALAERRIPGIASNLRVLLLGQTTISSDVPADGEGSDRTLTVLQYVTKSDAKRERALKQSSRLAAILEAEQGKPSAISKVVQELQLERALADVKEAELIASRRSGARGSKARQELIRKEEAVIVARARLDSVDDNNTDDMERGIELLEELRTQLYAMDAGSTEARARSILLGLGFKGPQIEAPAAELSGGWQSRCDLACALIQQTDVLLLDEPTNALDLPGIIWLQSYLSETMSGKTVVVVTHDRDFADAVAEELILLRRNPAKTIETFRGNLSEYEKEKRKQIRRMTKMAASQEKQIEHLEATIENSVRAAKRTGDDKKLKQAASRKKKVDERMGLMVNARGGRWRKNDQAGFFNTIHAAIEIPGFDPPVNIILPEQPFPLRNPGSLVSIEKMSFTWPKSKKMTLQDVDLIIHPGDRVGIVGLNGAGKSTLIKLIMQQLKPSKGSVTTHSGAKLAYYSQHAVEELEVLGRQDPSLTALTHLASMTGSVYEEQELRALLAKFGLRGAFVSEVPLSQLSGGQRVRLALAKVFIGSPHLLILDEVTTHLDSDTIVALINSLRSWQGALFVVTHDRYFMRCVVQQEKSRLTHEEDDDSDSESEEDEKAPGTVYRLFRAGLHKLPGGMSDYEMLVERQLARREA